MSFRWFCFTFLVAGLLSVSTAHAQNKIQSGPPKGAFLPPPFHPLNINGKYGSYKEVNITYKGRYHSLICEYGLQPVVLVFAKEDPTLMDAQLIKLLQGIEQAIEEEPDQLLRGFVVYLSPGAQTSVTEATLAEASRKQQPSALNSEAMSFDLVMGRLEKRAALFKRVIVTTYPLKQPVPSEAYLFAKGAMTATQMNGPMATLMSIATLHEASQLAGPSVGPPGFQIAAGADVTVVLYKSHRIQETFAFAPGELNDQNTLMVLNQIRAMVKLKALDPN